MKRYDEQKQEYSKVKKKNDPGYDWMRGYDPKRNISLNERDIKRIIKKLEKNPHADGMKLYNNEARKKVGIRKTKQLLAGIGSVAFSSLAALTISKRTFN